MSREPADMPRFADVRDGGNLPPSSIAWPYIAVIAVAFAAAGILMAVDPIAKVTHAIATYGADR